MRLKSFAKKGELPLGGADYGSVSAQTRPAPSATPRRHRCLVSYGQFAYGGPEKQLIGESGLGGI